MIRFSCACGKERQVPDMFAGRSVKCPDCGVVAVVPAAGAPPAAIPPPGAERLAFPGEQEAQEPLMTPRAVELLTQERFEQAKADAGRVRFHLPFTSLSGAALLVAFFLLPWLRLSCANLVIGEPTGYNLATNTQDSRTKTLEEKTKAVSASNPLLQGMDMSRLTDDAKEREKDPPWGGKSPELWVFPGLGLLLLAWGLVRMAAPSYSIGRETGMLLTLVLGCGTLLLYERLTWYRKPTLQKFTEDMRRAMETPGPRPAPIAGMLSEADRKELLGLFGISDQPGFWLTLVALCGAAFSMTAWLAFPSSKAG